MDELNERFTKVSNKLIKLKGLDCTEKMILINFISYGEQVYPSITRICTELEISRSTCIRKIKSLKEKGFLYVTKNKSLNGDCDNNSYNVVSNSYYLVSEKDYVTSKIKPQVVSKLDSNNTKYSHSENEILENIKNKYPKELIKNELDKLKEKGLNNLELLRELEDTLQSKKKQIKTECSNDAKTIFEHWNSKKIIVHKELSTVIKKSIEKSLEQYSLEEILGAIDTYSDILNSSFYFSYKWSLSDFLKRGNALCTFMEEGANKVNYDSWKKGGVINGYTKESSKGYRGRFTEGTENFEYKPKEYTGPSYTEEDYKRMYESGELI